MTSSSRMLRAVARRHALATALAAAYGVLPQVALANPAGAVVVQGQATLQAQGNRLTVTNTPGAIINWQQFSIGTGETTYFQQQSATSSVLNRVQAQNPALASRIDGTLGSNGRVFLINPNGVVFGAGSVIDTQGLVASTLSLRDEDFRSGKLRFVRDGVAGDIQLQGQIRSGNGDVLMVAPHMGVDASAIVRSQGGSVVLAAGERVEITGRNLEDITFEVQNRGNTVVNLGRLEGGAVGVFAGTLQHAGVAQAQTVAREGGRLVLRALGDVQLASASALRADGQTLGGSITVATQGGNLTLDPGAQVSAQATAPSPLTQAATVGGRIALSAPTGYVALEAGSQLSADGGRGGVIVVDAARLVQDGAVHADGASTLGGSVRLHADSRLIQSASASVSAQGVLRGGDVIVTADTGADATGHVYSSATIDASASSGVGGSVAITAHDVVLAAAQVYADGDAGGGLIRLGGGHAGADAAVSNAHGVVVNAATGLHADARVDGDGGSVRSWADGSNRFAGALTARGGAAGGNGGTLEVSAGQEVQFGGSADAGAPKGQGGRFLLDPQYIVIKAPTVVPGTSVELLDPNPGSNDNFGQSLQVLGNGNILVFDANDDFAATNSGAIYLFNGSTGALISNLRGSAANDRVGSGGIARYLGGSNLLLGSPFWNGSAGALTPFNPITGVSGSLSSANSLVGASSGDQIGSSGTSTLTGGKFAILSPNWNGAAGAVTWADGTSGVTGVVSASNSLVGASPNDRVGNSGIGSGGGKHYVATSAWSSNAGAVTWIDPAAPLVGAVGPSNSLVGSAPGDQVGSGGVYGLISGKWAIFSPDWNGQTGAVTFMDQATGLVGAVGAANSLVGSNPGDRVGGGYWDYAGSKIAIHSPDWANGGASAAGAITWMDATSIVTGAVSAANSLVGSNVNDRVGYQSLSYLDGVHSYLTNTAWNANRGAVTWIDSAAPPVGVVSSSNSLVGSSAGDRVGSGGVVNFGYGKAAVFSPQWAGNQGAVSWLDVTAGSAGVVGAANSLVGSNAGDKVGGSGNYYSLSGSKIAIVSPNWANTGTVPNAGAVTWVDASVGLTGAVSAANSLVGSGVGDQVGSAGIASLDGAHYVAMSSNWSSNRGAVTWIDSAAPLVGAVSSANSLVGAAANDFVGSDWVYDLGNGHALVFSPQWNGNRGAVTWLDSQAGTTGVVNGGNSLVGSSAGDQVGGNGHDWVGNYVAILSPNWTNASASAANAGAVTWADPALGISGVVSSANSLVGGNANDRVGNGGLDYRDGTHAVLRTTGWNGNTGAITWIDGGGTPPVGLVDASNSLVGAAAGERIADNVYNLYNGKSLVLSPNWGGNKGAATWFDDVNGTVGVVGAGNSLVGSTAGSITAGDRVGANYYQQLGNLIVLRTPNWNNGAATLAGAVTFADAASGVSGVLSATNSLVGSHVNDRVGSTLPASLGNGKYYLASTNWNGNAGAVTFVDPAATPLVGAIGATNSLVGSTAGDSVGSGGITTVGSKIGILSPNWNNGGIAGAGAITWVDPLTGITGAVTAANSLVGGSTNDHVGSAGAQYLSPGLSAVASTGWGGGAGAVTWINTAAPLTGVVNASNSLVGSSAGDQVGLGGFTYGTGYVVLRSWTWSGNRGAVTWIDLTAPLTGVVSSSNSLVGASANDYVGNSGVVTLSNGDYYVRSASFAANAGAVTVGSKAGGIAGVVSAANSLVGQNPNDGYGSSVQEISGSRLLVRASNADSGGLTNNGRVHIYSGGAGGGGGPGGPLGAQGFSDNMASLVTIAPAQIAAILNTGTSVVLQASSDITLDSLSDIVVNNPSGNGGNLTLQAGRSVLLNSNVLTDGGSLTVIGNELASNGVMAAYRDPGAAVIAMGDGTRIDAGSGTVTMLLRDGAGRTGAQADASGIVLRSISAGTLDVRSDTGSVAVGGVAASAPSAIVVLGNANLVARTSVSLQGGGAGAPALLSADGQITIASPDPQVDPAPALTLNNGGASARIVNPTGIYPLILSGAQCIGCTVVSDYEITGTSSNILEAITGSLLSLQTSFDDVAAPPMKKRDDEIAVDAGEICQ